MVSDETETQRTGEGARDERDEIIHHHQLGRFMKQLR